MARANPNPYRPSLAELSPVVEEYRRSWGVDMKLMLYPPLGTIRTWYAELILVEMVGVGHGPELERIRFELPNRVLGDIGPVVMHHYYQAIARLQNTPWSWTALMRRNMVGRAD